VRRGLYDEARLPGIGPDRGQAAEIEAKAATRKEVTGLGPLLYACSSPWASPTPGQTTQTGEYMR